MTAEYLTALAALVAIAISFRTSSHTELRSLYDSLRTDFDKYKKDSEAKEEKYEKKIEEMQTEIDALTKHGDNYKRYITRLIAQLEWAQIVPVKMDAE